MYNKAMVAIDKKKILIIDDDKIFSKVLKDAFLSMRWWCTTEKRDCLLSERQLPISLFSTL